MEEIVEAKDVHHGETVEARIETRGIRTKSVKEIGPVSSVATVTSPLELNVTDVDATKMARVATNHQIGHLEETTLGAIGDQEGDRAANASPTTEVEENDGVVDLAAHSETDAVVNPTHKVMNRNLCIGTTEAYRWEMRGAAQTISG